jgi:hypothetical protein
MEIQTKSAADLYPVNSTEVLTAEELGYIRQHVSATTTEQLRAISLAEHYAIHPEVWYSTQLQHDFKTSLLWCQRFRIPFTLTKPISVHPVVYTSGPIVFPQKLSLGDGSPDPPPSCQASQALSVECPDQTRIQSQSQTDEGSPEQIPAVAS